MNLKDLLKKIFPDRTKEIDDLEFEDSAAKAEVEKRTKELTSLRDQLQKLTDYWEKKKSEQDKKPMSPETEEMMRLIGELKEQNKGLEERLKEIGASTQSAAEKLRNDKIAEAIARAKKEMKIPGDNKDVEKKWQKILEADLENGSAMLDTLTPIAKTAAPKTTTPASGNSNSPSDQKKSPLATLTDEIRSQMAQH